MIVIDRYAKAVLPEPYSLLGLRLRPFSLGHYLSMQRYNCAFVSKTAYELRQLPGFGVADILLAIMICSRTFEDFQEFVNDEKEFSDWCNKWGKAIQEICSQKDFSLTDTITLFNQYVNEGMAVPLFFTEEKESGKSSGSNWIQNIQIILTGELGYSFSEVMNMPLSKAFHDYFKYAERSGLVELMTEDELQLIESARNHSSNV